MDTTRIKAKFARIGARANCRPLVPSRRRPAAGPVMIDVGRDRRGEYFDIQVEDDADVAVLDVQPKARHLLLMVRQPNERAGLPDIKDKFLCGHDERHWFVAALPEKAPVSNVVTAKEALKPDLVRERQKQKRGKQRERLRRKNDVFVRQGEWFFVPAPDKQVDENRTLTNEPITRSRGSKPHICEFLYREGGTTVYVCGRHPDGLTVDQYRQLLKDDPEASKWRWQTMVRDPEVFVRGKVTHPDHATIQLNGWHRVAMNTENRARAMPMVAFLD